MSLHKVVLDLPTESYELLRRFVDSGEYVSESDAIECALLQFFLEPADSQLDSPLELGLREELCTAYDEDAAQPTAALSPLELNAYLASERLKLSKVG